MKQEYRIQETEDRSRIQESEYRRQNNKNGNTEYRSRESEVRRKNK